jgi:nicotinamide-nucleotide amidase
MAETARAAPAGSAPAGTDAAVASAAALGEETGPDRLAAEILELMQDRGQTLAVAESLTGGLICAALSAVPGASAVLRGGIVAYATELKAGLLDVPQWLLDDHGPVHPSVAAAMADGIRVRLGATFSVATTGVAGPEPQGGQPVGTVHFAVSADGDTVVRTVALSGDRAEIRERTVVASLGLLLGRLREDTE